MSDTALKIVPRDPATPAEWQDAVNLAEVLLQIDSARQYGLVTGGPHVDVDRCQDVLHRGREQGYVPRDLDMVTRRLLFELTAQIRTPEKRGEDA